MKKCNICEIEKNDSEFHFRDKSSLTKKRFCILCEREKDRIRRQSDEYKLRVKSYRTKEERIERLNKWRKENPEKVKSAQEKWKEYNKKWKVNNLEKLKESRKKYNQNPKTKITESVRHRIKKYMLIKNITKKNKTFEIVGCTPDELKLHLEGLFVEGMSWDNYGFYGWHIDHKIPLSSANTEEELLSLCHFSNLQPLWAEDNLKKGASF
jgi:hypothetical protein